eukprot:Skav206616  [mRNA]  locus=scaffold1562:212120:213565:+ [translate_table: standard]
MEIDAARPFQLHNQSTWQRIGVERLLPLIHQWSREAKASDLASSSLAALEETGKGITIMVFIIFFLFGLYLLIRGLPEKPAQDPSVKLTGCPTSLMLFLCVTYAFIWFTTDQYVPSLPEMGHDLSGSQSMMSATVQVNLVIKAVVGLFTASLSDRMGRRPLLVAGLSLLSVASFCCGCAARIEWFCAARLLQALGESMEPLLFAITIDYLPKSEDRLALISYMQTLAMLSMTVAPIFGGFLAEFFTWRCSFFVLAIVWGLLGLYASAFLVESCPDSASGGLSYLQTLQKVMVPDLLCLLFALAGINASWLVFCSNVGYVVQVTYNQTRIATSFIMLVWAAICVLGLLFMRCHQVTFELKVCQTAAVQIVAVFAVAIVSLILSLGFSQFLWAYLSASFLQSMVETSTIVPLTTLFFEPLADCAGVAASFEILFKSIPPCLYCLLSTQSLVHMGINTFMILQSCTCVACVFFFFMYSFLRPKM